MINDLKILGEWKIELIIEINFMSSKDSGDSNENFTMHTKGNNTEIMTGNKTDEIFKKLFDSLLQRYQEGSEESMKGSEHVLDSVDLLYWQCHKVSLYRSGSYIDSPK